MKCPASLLFVLVVLLMGGCMPFASQAAAEPVAATEEDAADDSSPPGERVIYDQRQSGKYNINLSIKDFALIHIDQNDVDDELYDYEDYYYDENHLTVKPIQLMPLTQATPTAATSPSPTANPSKPVTPTSSTIPTTPATTPIPLATTQPSVLRSTRKPSIILPPSTIVDIPSPMKRLTTTTPQSITVVPQQEAEKPANTFSPNLLADLEATQKAVGKVAAGASGSTRPPLSLPPKRTQSVVILQTTPSIPLSSTHKPKIPTLTYGRDPASDTDQAPPRPMAPSESRQRYSNLQADDRTPQEAVAEDDSKIYKFQMRRTHKTGPASEGADGLQRGPTNRRRPVSPESVQRFKNRLRGCRRDETGKCRLPGKRSAASSSSILKKFLSMLVGLPFAARLPPTSDTQP